MPASQWKTATAIWLLRGPAIPTVRRGWVAWQQADYTVTVRLYDHLTYTDVVTLTAGQLLLRTYDLLPAGIISGFVKTSGAVPVAGALVHYVLPDASTIEAQTDANGYYEIHNLDYGPGAMVLDWGQQRQDVTITQVALNATASFTYTGTPLTGRVVQSDGTTPVEDAEVFLLKSGSVIATTSTDGNGNYGFSLVSSGVYSVTTVSSEGLSLPQTVNVSGSTSAPDLTLGSAQYKVTVKDANGQPVFFAFVLARPIGALDVPDGWGYFSPYLSELSDQTGQFTFKGLPAGTYELRVAANGYGTYRGTFTITSDTTSATINLSGGARVYGLVSLQSGVPISASAQVMLYDRTDPTRRYLTTAAGDGSYIMGSIPNGTYDGYAILNGYQAVRTPLTISGTQLIWSPQLITSTVVLTHTVRDAQGRGIAGVRVVVKNTRSKCWRMC